MGVGHPLMPVGHVARGLARLATKGVRTAKVLSMGGVPVVVTKALPEGVHAMMLADRIEAVRTATGQVVATVARDAFPCAAALPRTAGTAASGRLGSLDTANAIVGA
ncbi:hypothetical protein [Methylobacterium haplocladii]|uniref:hypothetical protein n=1 Tax=Methylobacterium haplocladii TaxID=1176176 RepID=UPI0011BF546B|nr:hypothetical protein [Methylobacterium haplocladii]